METLTSTKWMIDESHSEVLFKVKHLVISTVTGTFRKFNGSLESDNEDFDGARATFQLDVSSIDTNVSDRDAHLRSADFFNAEEFPYLTFEGVMKKKSGNEYVLSGDLTIRDVTKKLDLSVEYGGSMVDAYGNNKAGFEIRGEVNRKDFGLNWSMTTEAGGIVVGDIVKLDLNVQVSMQ